jgi:hypothetical protein
LTLRCVVATMVENSTASAWQNFSDMAPLSEDKQVQNILPILDWRFCDTAWNNCAALAGLRKAALPVQIVECQKSCLGLHFFLLFNPPN